MDIVLCIKQVPDVTEADLKIDKEGKDIIKDDLEMSINEWDNYAVEEAVRLKEKHGGKITVITLGDEDSEDVLRRALAMGADEAIRIDEEGFENSDPRGIALGLYHVIKELNFDLILTGAQSSDMGWAQVGVRLAEMLNIPYATLAMGIEVADGKLIVKRELESNTFEKVELALPALVTVQTGINEPRYVSIMGIRRVRKLKIDERSIDELDISEDEVGEKGSIIESAKLMFPPEGEGAEILQGSLDEVCEKLAQIIKEKGGL